MARYSWLRGGALAIAVVTAALTAGCSSSGGGPAFSGPLTLASPAFAPGKTIPVNYTCAQAGNSPPLAWTGKAPSGTKGWAIVATDTSVNYTHWIVTGLTAKTRALATAALPLGAVASRATNGAAGYVPLCPPQGAVHQYRFTVFALRSALTIPATAKSEESLQAIQQASLGSASLTGSFGR